MRVYEFGLYFVICNFGVIENVGKYVLLVGWVFIGVFIKF